MKEQKGITLLTLTITIVVLLILIFTININAPDLLQNRRKNNFQNDISSLKEEIDHYYARYDGLPIINKYTNISMLEGIKNVNDNENYYVIDLSKISVNLNYGKEYEKVKSKDTSEEITDILDVYIINDESHTIYYPQGIEYDGTVHYTILDTYNMIKVEDYVNRPKLLEGMTPIKFTMPTESKMGEIVTTTETDKDWYKYGTTYETRKWANAKTQDGSMWVWIPRFAYRITYYTDSTKQVKSTTKTQYGSIDVVFLIGTTDNYYDENGAIKTAQRQTEADQTIDSTADYTVHPAFTNESTIGFANGGWDSELTGIWVAKFEAGYASGNNTAPVVASNVKYSEASSYVYETESTTGVSATVPARNWLDGIYGKYENNTYSWLNGEVAIKYPTFQGTTYAMNYITHNDAFKIAKALTDSGNIYGLNNSNADSHLMKNSEWGAVAYLSQSEYGLNGTEITTNNINLNSGGSQRTEVSGKSGVDSVYAVTGCTSNTTDKANNKTTINAINGVSGNTANSVGIYVWNQKTGQNASSTGTIYGIYDISGGTWEKTANFISNGNTNLYAYGKSLLDETDLTYTIDENTNKVTVTENTGSSTKYVTIYPNNEAGQSNTDIASQKNFAANTKIYGDAIRETTASTAGTSNTGWNAKSWNSDYSCFPGIGGPFFLRGASLSQGFNTGLFAFGRNPGNSVFDDGFRAVLVSK